LRDGTAAQWPHLIPSANEFTAARRKRKPGSSSSGRQQFCHAPRAGFGTFGLTCGDDNYDDYVDDIGIVNPDHGRARQFD
jgi:hypothetical protein